jgi:GTP:adenosylcobinamide-phosphate guanylyltransferase
MGIPAIVTAGDRGAARSVHGESKVFLRLAGRPLVVHTLLALQAVPEVSEIWVVGDAERLAAALAEPEVRARLRKPIHVLEQFRNLYENAWETYRRLLPGAGPAGRDPQEADLDRKVLYLSADLPFATPQEISQFIERAQALDCDYALGLVGEDALAEFLPPPGGGPGIRVATFDLREGRLRQSNLHLVAPARLRNRHYIQEMYEHRHQRELRQMLGVAWRLLRFEKGGLAVLWYFLLMHLAMQADVHGWRGLADRIRRLIPIARIERGVGDLLGTRFRFVVTDVGGCAMDIDLDEQLDAAEVRFEEWREQQARRAERLVGPLPLAPGGAPEAP